MGCFKKHVFVLMVLLMCGSYTRAQKDTVYIGRIDSSVPIVGKLADLQYVFGGKGEWCYSSFNWEISYYPWTVTDTLVYVYHVNTIYDKKTQTSYASDNEGNIRLRYLDFKLARGAYMSLRGTGLFLTYETTLDEFIKAFNITDTIEFGPALMAPWNYYKKNGRPHHWRHRQFTSLWFWTEEGRRVHIIFSFDDKRHLRCVELDYFNEDHVEVRPLR